MKPDAVSAKQQVIYIAVFEVQYTRNYFPETCLNAVLKTVKMFSFRLLIKIDIFLDLGWNWHFKH